MSATPDLSLSEQLFLRWDPELLIFVDEQGLPVPRSTFAWMADRVVKHLSYSPLEFEAIARRVVDAKFPHVKEQLDWEYFL